MSEPKTQLTLVTPVKEKNFIIEAAKRVGAESLNSFLLGAALKEAASVLGRDPGPEDEPLTIDAGNRLYQTIHVYIGALPSAGSEWPAVSVRNLQDFATLFSDRNQQVLRWLASHEPESIHALAGRFDYPYQALSKNLSRLASYGFVDLVKGDGARKVPVLNCRKVIATMLFADTGTKKPQCLEVTFVNSKNRPRPRSKGLSFKSMDDFMAYMPERGYLMLAQIGRDCPQSVLALAKKGESVDGNKYKMVSKLQSAGFLELKRTGHKKRPVLLFDGIRLELDLTK